jgi:hypothetical protein
MSGVLIRATVALAAGLTAAAAAASGHDPRHAPVTPFGGSVAVHVAQPGRIDVDLAPASSAGLRRVRCSGQAAGSTACFVGR